MKVSHVSIFDIFRCLPARQLFRFHLVSSRLESLWIGVSWNVNFLLPDNSGSRQHRLGTPRAVIRPVRGSVRGRLVAVVHGKPDHRDVLVGGPSRNQSSDERFLTVLGGARHVADDNLLGSIRCLEGLPGELIQKVVSMRSFGIVGDSEAIIQVDLLEVTVVLHRRCFSAARRRRKKDYDGCGTYPAHSDIIVTRWRIVSKFECIVVYVVL